MDDPNPAASRLDPVAKSLPSLRLIRRQKAMAWQRAGDMIAAMLRTMPVARFWYWYRDHIRD